MHAAGLVLALPASVLLLRHVSAVQGPDGLWTATAIYLGALVFALLASALYHMLPFDRSRALLGRIDHASIYFKIAGTYTPLVVLIGSGFAYGVLGLVWALAIFGALAKLTVWRPDGRGSLALYLAMGWLSVLLVWPMWQNLPGMTLALVAIGGGIYSAGTWVYAHPNLRFQNAIWHFFVLVATGCFFAAIARAVGAA